jgi:hypothetical protein
MKFEQGHPKYAGRAKGTPNKSTTNLKSSILSIVEKSFETIEDDLQDMETKEKVGFVLKLIDFNSLSDEEIDGLISRLNNTEDES